MVRKIHTNGRYGRYLQQGNRGYMQSMGNVPSTSSMNDKTDKKYFGCSHITPPLLLLSLISANQCFNNIVIPMIHTTISCLSVIGKDQVASQIGLESVADLCYDAFFNISRLCDKTPMERCHLMELCSRRQLRSSNLSQHSKATLMTLNYLIPNSEICWEIWTSARSKGFGQKCDM
jgi:hypothetical protein